MVLKFLLISIVVALLSIGATLVHGDIGTARAYKPPYTPTKCNGNRPEQFPPGNLFVSVSDALWDNGAACGRRYRLRCLSGKRRPCKVGSIDVRVVDYCSKTPCPSTIIMSIDAFAAISRHARAKINVEFIEGFNREFIQPRLAIAG